MHALWCCGPRRSHGSAAGSKISFTSIFRTSSNPAVDTSKSHGLKTKPKGEPPSEQVSPFEGPVELCQLAAGSLEQGDPETVHPGTRTSTFDGVKAKIIKHLSQEGGPRRHSRVSIGHSDEELARRAEVRRLQQKQIQDELNKDDNDGHSHRSHHSARYLSALIDLGSPCSGPRDTLEFTFDDCVLVANPSSSDFSSTQSTPPHCETNHQVKPNDDTCENQDRNLDSPLETQSNAEEVLCQSRPIRGPLPERRCVSMVSISPRPSSCQPGTPRLDRIIGLDNEFNIRHGSHAWDDQSALGIWLIAQGMKPTDSSVLQNDNHTKDKDPSPYITRVPTEDLGGVDSILESSSSILDRLAAAEAALVPHAEEKYEDSIHTASVTSEQRKYDVYSAPGGAIKPGGQREDTKQRANNGSSNYPSELPSLGPSPSGSESHSYVLSQRDLDNLELSPVHWCGNLSAWEDLGQSEGQSSYETADEQPSSELPGVQNMLDTQETYLPNLQQSVNNRTYCRKSNSQVLLPGLDQANTTSQSCNKFYKHATSTTSRVCFKEKLQYSLYQISNLGSSSSKISLKLAGIAKAGKVKHSDHSRSKIRYNFINRTFCDIAEARSAKDRSTQPTSHQHRPRTE